MPIAADLVGRGWTVEGAAAGLDARSVPGGSFGAVHDVGFSRRAVAPWTHLRSFWAVRRLIARRDYDVVHLHTPIAAALTRLAVGTLPRSRRPSVVYTAHGFHFYEGAPRSARIYEWLERLLAPLTDVVFTINEEDFDAARRLFSCEVHRLPGIGLDLSHYDRDKVDDGAVQAPRAKLGIGLDTFVILVVASLDPGKRHDRLLRALGGWDREFVLLLAGDGPNRDNLEAQVAAAGLEASVHFLGAVNDVRALLVEANCLVLASEREGLPRSVMEAMAMGTPVIGSDIRGVRDLLEDGAGVLVDADDPVAVRAALDRVADDQSFRDRLVETARRRVAQYDQERVLECHGEVIDRLDPGR